MARGLDLSSFELYRYALIRSFTVINCRVYQTVPGLTVAAASWQAP